MRAQGEMECGGSGTEPTISDGGGGPAGEETRSEEASATEAPAPGPVLGRRKRKVEAEGGGTATRAGGKMSVVSGPSSGGAPHGNKNGFESKKGGVVQIASYDYLSSMTIEQYFERCKRYKQLTPEKQALIRRLKELRDEGALHSNEHEQEVGTAMHLTFTLRNYDIFKKSLSVRNAVDIYPGLTLFRELRREFERITQKDMNSFQRHINCVLKEYAREQMKQKCYMCSNKFCTQAWDIIREAETKGVSTARKTAARVMIYSCAQSQRKWSDVIYKVLEAPSSSSSGEEEEEEEGGGGMSGRDAWVNTNRPHPTVVVHGSPFEEGCSDLYCEDTRILSRVNFYEAVLACYFLYYIFNIDYPAVDAETFQPFDNVMSLMHSTTENAPPDQ